MMIRAALVCPIPEEIIPLVVSRFFSLAVCARFDAWIYPGLRLTSLCESAAAAATAFSHGAFALVFLLPRFNYKRLLLYSVC
jgi:hypothetical protein